MMMLWLLSGLQKFIMNKKFLQHVLCNENILVESICYEIPFDLSIFIRKYSYRNCYYCFRKSFAAEIGDPHRQLFCWCFGCCCNSGYCCHWGCCCFLQRHWAGSSTNIYPQELHRPQSTTAPQKGPWKFSSYGFPNLNHFHTSIFFKRFQSVMIIIRFFLIFSPTWLTKFQIQTHCLFLRRQLYLSPACLISAFTVEPRKTNLPIFSQQSLHSDSQMGPSMVL